MERSDRVFEVLKRNLLLVVPDLDPKAITPERSMVELGCNSIDRAEVIALTMEHLRVDVPIPEFLKVDNLRSLADLLSKH